ncbi:uncharacterized protein NPIL_306831 [Nephila pilipes]|uniref:Integrase zinc-binding domain-containing protein n=1 Tax=Nephila pilipes TaxID=299642 RepID=A0A8X6TDB7_NEPPI|nr:uncharacterized protein NPIL_306831 [Nephila pilipes]
MVLRKWQTNSVRLHEAWRRAGIEIQEDKTSKQDVVLLRSTEKLILQILGHIFDPIEFLRPFNIKLKLLLEERWVDEKDWGEKENPADFLSRSISASTLAKNSLWRHEPPWQSNPSEYWAGKIEIGNHMGDLELREEFQIIVQNKCVVHDSQFDLDLNMYSDFHKVLKIIASIKRFVNRKLPIEIGSYNATELLKADQDVIKYEQNLVSTSELEYIKDNKLISKTSSPYKEHNKVCHGGVSAILDKIRSRYWVPKGRQIVKRVLKDCLLCRKYCLRPAQ